MRTTLASCGLAAALATAGAMASAQEMTADEFAASFFPMLLAGQGEELLASMDIHEGIDTPRGGRVSGNEQTLREFLAAEHVWLKEYGADAETIRPVKTTANEDRVVYELNMSFDKTPRPGGQRMAVVVDRDQDGTPADVRVYYIYGSITGDRTYHRPPVLDVNPEVLYSLAPPVLHYVSAINNSSFDAWRVFSGEGSYFNSFKYPMLKRFYAVGTIDPGGIPLRPAAVTCDNTTCALEENLASWGEQTFANDTGGLAIYDYNDKGQVTGARIYDDIPNLFFLQPGWMAENWEELSEMLDGADCSMSYTPKPDDDPYMLWGMLTTAPCENPG